MKEIKKCAFYAEKISLLSNFFEVFYATEVNMAISTLFDSNYSALPVF